MAEKKKKGLMARLIEGSEKAEGYARSTLPSNRWELFWDIFKGRFSKLFIINILVVLFLIPLFILMFLKTAMVSSQAAYQPFAQNLLNGYPLIPSLVGLEESVYMQTNIIFYALLPLGCLLFSIGISGGFYVIRNMVWTEGIFISNDFWRGIKLNYGVILKSTLFYTVILFLTTYSMNSIDLLLVVGNVPHWVLYMGKISSYIIIILSTIMTMYMCTLGVTYDLKFFKLIRNSFLLTIGMLPTNAFFIILAMLPFLITTLGGFFAPIGYMIIATFGISTGMLGWTNYSQWVFDKFINDKVEGAQKNRGIYEKVSKNESKAVEQYRKQVELLSNSSLSNRPIKPITDKDLVLDELPVNYSRKHLQQLEQSRERIYKDNEEYIEKHKNDEKFIKPIVLTEEIEPSKEASKDKKEKKDKTDKNR